MLEIYSEVEKICKKHHIPIWINGGTLLGAVRHKGFIPWDDDFDTEILRKDYKKLLSALEQELPSHLVVQARKKDKSYPYYFAKVFDLNSEAIENNKLISRQKYNGLFIDIFPIEPAFPKIRKILNKYFVKSHFAIVKGGFKRVIAYPFFYILKLIISLYRFLTKTFRAKHYMYVFGQKSKQIYTYDMIFPLSEVEFEVEVLPCPGDWNRYLIANFGENYMTPPPPEKRQVHHQEIKSIR
jgi:lipopolysaccharide cholinephosphotransferase